MTKKLCLITLIGGTDIIGELEHMGTDEWTTLWRPCVVQFTAPNNVQIRELLRNTPFLTGEYVELNMRAVQWIGQPEKALAAAYHRIKSGVIIPSEAVGMNQ